MKSILYEAPEKKLLYWVSCKHMIKKVRRYHLVQKTTIWTIFYSEKMSGSSAIWWSKFLKKNKFFQTGRILRWILIKLALNLFLCKNHVLMNQQSSFTVGKWGSIQTLGTITCRTFYLQAGTNWFFKLIQQFTLQPSLKCPCDCALELDH